MSRRIAFLWGSNANKHYPTLKYAKRDVERLRGTLSSSRYGFEAIVPPDGSSPHQIHESILDAISSCAPEDVFIGYFSGHGQLIGSKLYLVLDKSVPSETKTLFSSTWLIDAFQACQARNRLLILDCCYAGAATGVKGGSVDVTELFPEHRDEPVLYASGKLEAAREFRELEGSFLTHVLCKSLAAAPAGSVTLPQVVDALKRAAIAHNRQASLQHQVPIPYLSGPQRSDFHFTSPGDSQDNAPLLRIVIDQVTWPNRRARPGRFKRAIAALRMAARAAASDGQGAYFFAMLAFGLAALLFHNARQIPNEGNRYLQENIQRQQEPLRAELYPVLDGLLLPEGVQGACTESLIAKLDEAYKAFKNAIKEQAAKPKDPVKPKESAKPKEPPKKEATEVPPLKKTNQLKTQGVGASWTDGDPDSTLIIPSSLAYLPSRRMAPGPGCDQPHGSTSVSTDPCCRNEASQIYCAFQESIEYSRAITSISNYLDVETREGFRISFLYFISPEGVVRTVPHWDQSITPAHHVYNGESYVYNTLSRIEGQCPGHGRGRPYRYTTLPYFELTGNGAVETTCYPVDAWSPEIATGRQNTTSEQTIGVLCADITLPEQEMLTRLIKASAVFDISVVRVSPRASSKEATACSKWPHACDKRLAQIADTESEKQASVYYRTIINPSAGGIPRNIFSAGGIAMLSNDLFGISVFHRPVNRDVSEFEYWDIALIKIRSRQTLDYASLSLSIVCLIIGICTLVLSFRRKLKRQQSLLPRGLQYGLLELSDGKIIGANDRAEEILRTKLPRLGIHSARAESGKTFAPMIHDMCVLLPPHGAPLSEADACSYDGKIRDRAADGLTSVFYAWVTRTRAWIKVTSTVILLPSGAEHVFCAIDTAIERLHKDLLVAVARRFGKQEEE